MSSGSGGATQPITTTASPGSFRNTLVISQPFSFGLAEWETCTCNQEFQLGKRCFKNGTVCKPTRRRCREYPCPSIPSDRRTTTAAAKVGERTQRTRGLPYSGTKHVTYEVTTEYTVTRADGRISRTRPPPRALITTSKITYTTTTGNNTGTTPRGVISPDTAENNAPVILGAAIGCVALIAILGLVILLVIMKRKSRRGTNEKNVMCCWTARSHDNTNANNNPLQPEMTRHHHDSSDMVDPRPSLHAYEGASFRQGDDCSHFYETVPSRTVANRLTGYDKLALPRVRGPQEYESGTEVPHVGGDTVNEASHEYLELVDSGGTYNHIQGHRSRIATPGETYDVMHEHSTRPADLQGNAYDVLKDESPHNEEYITPTSKRHGNYDFAESSTLHASNNNDHDTVTRPRGGYSNHHYNVLEKYPN